MSRRAKIPQDDVTKLDHDALLKTVSVANDSTAMNWDIDWKNKNSDDPRKMPVHALLDDISTAKEEFRQDNERVHKQRHRMEHNLFKKYNILVDSRIHGRSEWHSALHIDPELQRSLRRPPVNDQAPERTISFRDPTTHDPELHDYCWFPPSEISQCFGTYSNPTPASGLTDHTRQKFMDHLESVIAKITDECDELEAAPHLSNEKTVLKARLGADLYQLRKQFVRLKVGGDVDSHTLKEHVEAS